MSFTWDDVGDAVYAAVQRAAGAGVSVVWKNQDRNAPELDYAAIQLAGIIPIGIDYIATSQDLTRPRGQEIELRVRGRREVALEIECFSKQSISGRQTAALALCSIVTMGLRLPSVATLLQAQDIAVFDPGSPQWIADVPSTKFRGRAVATVRTYMSPPTAAEYVGYIERMSGTVTMQGSASGDLTRPFDTGPADD